MSEGRATHGAGRLLETAAAWLLGLLWILPLAYAGWTAFHPREFSARFVLSAPLTLQNFVDAWQAALRAAPADLVVRRNYPYRGVSDALVTYLRRRYAARGYVGLEVEVNQKHVDGPHWRALVTLLSTTLATAETDTVIPWNWSPSPRCTAW